MEGELCDGKVGDEVADEIGVAGEGEAGRMELRGIELGVVDERDVGMVGGRALAGCLTTFVRQIETGQM